ncbi:hypothetical protein OIV83_003326 [Microbotryomycetes sp. JL201]|nr:hypothetical protein OIV83_003326 [Microbotryomycetes sp. JL201]
MARVSKSLLRKIPNRFYGRTATNKSIDLPLIPITASQRRQARREEEAAVERQRASAHRLRLRAEAERRRLEEDDAASAEQEQEQGHYSDRGGMDHLIDHSDELNSNILDGLRKVASTVDDLVEATADECGVSKSVVWDAVGALRLNRERCRKKSGLDFWKAEWHATKKHLYLERHKAQFEGTRPDALQSFVFYDDIAKKEWHKLTPEQRKRYKDGASDYFQQKNDDLARLAAERNAQGAAEVNALLRGNLKTALETIHQSLDKSVLEAQEHGVEVLVFWAARPDPAAVGIGLAERGLCMGASEAAEDWLRQYFERTSEQVASSFYGYLCGADKRPSQKKASSLSAAGSIKAKAAASSKALKEMFGTLCA